jgi:hypothetical protein
VLYVLEHRVYNEVVGMFNVTACLRGRIESMKLWTKVHQWLMRNKRRQPESCPQPKQMGVAIPEKKSIREAACLSAKNFVSGMGEETRKVWNDHGNLGEEK